ncbi:AMP-binding protein [Rhodococcus aetherivorans]|uniref:AMP-binding protein n=1 Tax=Rhodococcus aetherivorans TaxID=191292 RepID=UPI00163A5A0A|nr:AMP-binding protein [Rhodococcus aetherivorans]MBC2592368.1 AMP-binding protein [Rhodococcus aetherivorans]
MTHPDAFEYTIGDMAVELGKHYPRHTATICEETSHTYADFVRRAELLATELAADGVGRGDRLLWLGQNCHRLLETLAAASMLGASLCPVNWRLSTRELQFIYSDLAPKIVFVQSVNPPTDAKNFVSELPGTQITYDYDGNGDGSYEQLLGRGSMAVPRPSVTGRDAVLIIYGMAWDGDPNGSMLCSDNLLIHAPIQADLQDIDRHTVLLASGPLFHIGMWQTLIPVLMYGGTVVLAPSAEPEQVADLISRHRITRGYIMQPTAEKIAALPDIDDYDLSLFQDNLQVPGWTERVRRDPSPFANPAGRVYGQTEVGGSMAYGALGHADGYRMCGRPAPGYRTRIVDADGAVCLPGQIGEITVRGPHVHLGYWNRPEVNDLRWRGGWWHTGDLGFVDADGVLVFVGPKGRLVKSGAENIFPAEVERALELHPAISEAAVIGVPDPQWGQNVVAIVVSTSQALTETEVIDHCRSQLASYKKPKAVHIRTEPLPRNSFGAKDHDALDRQYGGGGYPGVPG